MRLTFVISFIFSVITLIAQVKKPFPQHVSYHTGSIKPNHLSPELLDKSVTAFYGDWKKRYIRKGCNDKEFYVWSEGVKGSISVSEGQGYGMLIIVYMAGFDSNAREIYDGLYKYYRSHPSRRSPYLMAWKQRPGCRVDKISSASDGDLDIAYSLLLANDQWGSEGSINYRVEAKNMIHEIMEQEVNSKTFSILLSNDVEYDSKDYFDTRTSDFMPAYFKAFASVSNESGWQKAVDKNYALFTRFQRRFSVDAGLVPDFIVHINKNPLPARSKYLESGYDGCYNYNACRVPWRIGIDYLLTGDTRGKVMVDRINTWIRGTTGNAPDNISAGYTLAGDDIHGRFFEALSFIAPFGVAAMADGKNQLWLNKLWDYLNDFKLKDFDYYDNTIKMICMLILTGNYWPAK